MRTAAIIVAGGSGERFGRAAGKQLLGVAGRPLVSWSLSAFDAAPEIDEIIVVCPPALSEEFVRDAVEPLGLRSEVSFACSGSSRQESVAAGLRALPPDVDVVAVHDGARPLIDPQLVTRLIAALRESEVDGVVVGYPSVDTLKSVRGDRVVETPDRGTLWAIQTPQVFRRSALEHAHEAAKRAGFIGTDDASLVERDGGTVTVLEGPRSNIKLTVPEDLVFIEAALDARPGGRGR